MNSKAYVFSLIAGSNGNGGVTSAFRVNTQGGMVANNTAVATIGSVAGATYDSSPAGVCLPTYGNLYIFSIFSN